MWKNFVQWGRPQMTVERMRIARWISKATHTHSEYTCKILIAVTLQQWLHDRASLLRNMYVACLI